MNYIKDSICNNDFLKNNLNIDNVDWELCHKNSLKNKLIEICDYWKENSNNTCVSDVAKLFSIATNTVLKYLHIGTEIGLCYYDRLLENRKAGKNEQAIIMGLQEELNNLLKKEYLLENGIALTMLQENSMDMDAILQSVVKGKLVTPMVLYGNISMIADSTSKIISNTIDDSLSWLDFIT